MTSNPDLLAGQHRQVPSSASIASMHEISVTEYDRFCSFLERSSGIRLGNNKEYLIKSRLRSLLEESNYDTLSQLLAEMEKGHQGRLQSKIVDAMTTNETLWFRDIHPFNVLKELIYPELEGKRSRPVRIWSAAASTGQEAYSISIATHEYLQKKPGSLPQDVEIIGTDISVKALQQARAACYDEIETSRGLSADRLKSYFQHKDDQMWVRDDIKKRVRFQELNLLNSYATLGSFEVIFCRNVLIYFSNELKSDILSRMAKALKPGGYLFLGGSEPIANYSDEFEMIRCPQGVVYKLKSS